MCEVAENRIEKSDKDMIISKDLFLLGDQDYLRLPKEEKRIVMATRANVAAESRYSFIFK